MLGGTVSVVPATAKKGDIGVYQEAIGTVTPVYTSTIISQVTGQIVAVHYTEGQTGPQRRSAGGHRSPPL